MKANPRSELSGLQKAAVVLMQLDQEAAAAVMRELSETEAQDLATEIARLRRVEAAVADAALAEFHELTLSGQRPARGGKDVAAGLLEATYGRDRASGVMDRLSASMAGRSFEFLEDVDAGQISSLLDGELPQTAALVMAHLQPDHASAVLAGLPEASRVQVAQAIAEMGPAVPEAVALVAESLKSRVGAVVTTRNAGESLGGIQPLVDILNRSDAATERGLLASLAETDPALAEEVRSRLFTFADLAKLENLDLQKVLRGADPALLALALRGAPTAVVEAIESNISERTLAALAEETSIQRRVRSSQVEDARAEIVRAVRALEAQGEVNVRRMEEDSYV
ncbi:flagellar motor switch protein FliG [Zafaria cholistanensis]|uniref:Flagellar motor switch protein FliG n=1 Tax=Zafaria cholistanensis TaxID=1682741 RepID=A0A5A7NL04_9MICC|nr:flagellar motor switch protein FliG [Zafaria cholistanensis]GER21643.1 flagellar motor switch protein FliG [Zafaria cholistanensis]